MIEFESVGKSFNGKSAVQDLSFTCEQGQFTVLIGSSGSGKSTTLKMVNRLIERDCGVIRFAGQDIRAFDARSLRRRMGYAIQSIGLFPHWTVAENIATVPTLLKWPKAKIARRVDELLELLKLKPEPFRARYPHQLSGGQQQRVGVARALAADPEVLLMDEPFGALDPVTRSVMQQEIARIHKLQGCTIILVTHDIDEALLLADRLVLMNDGVIVQQGKPLSLLTHPATPWVRDFFGHGDRGLRLLALRQVQDALRRDEACSGEPLSAGASLRDAISAFVERQVEKLPVMDDQGQYLGTLHFSDLIRPEAGGEALA